VREAAQGWCWYARRVVPNGVVLLLLRTGVTSKSSLINMLAICTASVHKSVFKRELKKRESAGGEILLFFGSFL
jgi:hypothetical protein